MVKLFCFIMISSMVLVMAVNLFGSGINSELEGVFTNDMSEKCPSFLSVEFNGDMFVATMNIPITNYEEVSEHFSERLQLSAEGVHFIRIIQQGRFIKSNDVYSEGIALLFPCGSIRHHSFSRTESGITVGQSHLTALH